jgi:hypothetical protein
MGIPQRARHLARYLVRARTVRANLRTTLTAEVLCAVLDDYALDDDGFTEADWLLQDWLGGLGGTATIYGPQITTLATFPTIVSTSIPWERGSDARDAFGPLGKAFRYTLVMPRLHSRNAMMLRWEVRDLPLM